LHVAPLQRVNEIAACFTAMKFYPIPKLFIAYILHKNLTVGSIYSFILSEKLTRYEKKVLVRLSRL